MNKKTIVIIGICNNEGSTNVPMTAAFFKQRCNVIPINYRTIIQNHGMEFFDNLLIEVVKSQKPDLVLFSKCNGINSELVTECNKYSKTWLWNMDPKYTIENCIEVIQHARNATFASCTSVDIVEWFKEQKVDPCYYILEGFDYDVLKPTEVYDKYKADISFIGTKTYERDMYKKKLEDAGYNVKFYGPYYSGKFVTGKEFAKICSSSKFMLSLNTYNDIPNYFSDRLILFTGCGACTLHLDSTKTLNNYFQDNKEVIYFSDMNELLKILEKTSDRKACEIAFKGRERVLREYTWDHTIYQILTYAGIK